MVLVQNEQSVQEKTSVFFANSEGCPLYELVLQTAANQTSSDTGRGLRVAHGPQGIPQRSHPGKRMIH